jgi:hypothetical protein
MIKLFSFTKRRAVVFSVLIFCSFMLQAEPQSAQRILNSKLFHIGDNEVALVPEASFKPVGERLDLKFDSDKIKAETTVELTYWEVNDPATVEIKNQRPKTWRAFAVAKSQGDLSESSATNIAQRRKRSHRHSAKRRRLRHRKNRFA